MLSAKYLCCFDDILDLGVLDRDCRKFGSIQIALVRAAGSGVLSRPSVTLISPWARHFWAWWARRYALCQLHRSERSDCLHAFSGGDGSLASQATLRRGSKSARRKVTVGTRYSRRYSSTIARSSFALFRAASSDHTGVLPIFMKRWRSLMR
jgi:hypothetical protein